MLMNPDIVLEVDRVAKKFSRNLKSSLKYGSRDIIRNAFGIKTDSTQLRPEEFWALKDISLQLKRGESLGLLGLNGAGKSTLMKLINGLYLPDEGEIRIVGKIGALIELGTGFHPLLSGKENIYTKGALMGLSREEIDAIFDDIVAFADIGEFIHSPVKTYSSGMFARLGFSVAVHIDPDILLVDEVLAVGDFKFKQKCLDKINEMRERMSVIFVSHNVRDITLFCNRAIVLEKGTVAFEGHPDEAVKFYLEEVEKQDGHKNKPRKGDKTPVRPFCGPMYHDPKKITDVGHCWIDDEGNRIDRAKYGSKISLYFQFRLHVKPKNLIIGIPIWDKAGNYITGISTDMSNEEIQIGRDGTVRGRLELNPLIFNTGEYVSVLSIHDNLQFFYRSINRTLTVEEMPKYFGFVTVPASWDFTSEMFDRISSIVEIAKPQEDALAIGAAGWRGVSSADQNVVELTFEDVMQKWVPREDVILSTEIEVTRSERSSMRISGVSREGEWDFAESRRFSIAPGKRYKFGGWMLVQEYHSPSPDISFWIKLGIYREDAWHKNILSSSYDLKKLGEWQYLSAEFTAPDSKDILANVTIDKRPNDAEVSSVIYINSIKLERVELEA